MEITLHAEDLSRRFDGRTIFRDVSFSVRSGQTLLITGKNGSGKSTLVKILCGVLSATRGTVDFRFPAGKFDHRHHLGLVAPYLQLYEEFSAAENLDLALQLRGRRPDPEAILALLEHLGLPPRRNDPVRTYSSGMKQRVKYGVALVHRPPVLILDEPMSNLDVQGSAMVRSLMHAQRNDGILVIATNDLSDVETFDHRMDLDGTA